MSQGHNARVRWIALGFVAMSVSCGPDPLVFENNSQGMSNQPNTTTTSRDFGSNQPIDYGNPFADMGGLPNNGQPNDNCVLDETICAGEEQFRRCIPNNAGGTQWSQPSFCPYAKCVDETGLCCDVPCPGLGAKKCGGGGVQTCQEIDGCLVWSDPEPCLEGATCAGAGVCEAGCQSSCTPGEQKCVMEGGGAYQKCEDIGGGCYQFAAQTFNCGGGATCNNGECMATCSNACSSLGDKQCVGTNEQECVRGASGCLEWAATGNPMACGPTCTDRCPSDGAERCDMNNNEQICRTQTNGCLDWQNKGTPCVPLQECYSSTLERNVAHGECLQNNPGNTYFTCPDGKSDCLWVYCNDGKWNYQCNQGNLGVCANVTTRYPNSGCNI